MSDPTEQGTPHPGRLRHKNRIWAEQVLTRSTRLRALSVWMQSRSNDEFLAVLDEGISRHLDIAETSAGGRNHRGFTDFGGSAIECAVSNLDAAESLLLLRAPDDYIQGHFPGIHSDVRRYLEAEDPRRRRIEALSKQILDQPVTIDTRESLGIALTASRSHSRQQYIKVRNFRNAVVVATVVLFSVAVALGIWGLSSPQSIPLCFNPDDKIVCPAAESLYRPGNGDDKNLVILRTAMPFDIFLIQFVGLVAAAVSGATSLHRMEATPVPFSLPIALTVLKLPTGALTAVLGLVLMGGGFVPGLSALDSAPQILAWAILFGASQQLLTGLVDRQARGVLDGVGGKPHGSRI